MPAVEPGPGPPTMPTQLGWHWVTPLDKAFRQGCRIRGDNWQEACRLFTQNSSEKHS